jgi:hypothetical protein
VAGLSAIVMALPARSRFDGLGAARLEEPGLELLAESVTVALDVDGDGVMKPAIEDGGGDHRIAEHLASGPEALIAAEDDGPALVAAQDELEEEVGALAVDGDVADLVDDEQLRLPRELEALVEPVLGEGLAEGGDEARGRGEERAHALLAGLEPEGDGQMSLADARRAEEQDIITALDVPGSL